MRFLRFRIISLLALIAIVAGALAWWVQPKMVTAKASFLVQDNQSKLERLLSPDIPPPTDLEIQANRETARAMLVGPRVIRTALTNLSAAKTFLKNVDNPEEWIIEHVSAEYDGDSEVLDVRLRGPEEVSAELVTIMKAICQAYMDEYVRANRIEQVKLQDDLKRTHRKLADELRQKLGELQRLEEELGDASKTSPEMQLRRAECEMLMQSWKDLAIAIQRQDILLNPSSTRGSIQLVEAAYIEPD